MNVNAERSVSLWMATVREWQAQPLTANERADVVVVGSGIAGLSTAYELCRQGQSVIVADRGAIGRGMTARTSAHLASVLDDFYHKLIGIRGRDEARHYLHSQIAALDRVEQIQQTEEIECDFRRIDGYLFAASDDDVSLLEREIDACHSLGFSDVAWDTMPAAADGREYRCLRFLNQARFHPLKYLEGLMRCIQREGGRIYADTPVMSVEEKDGETIVRTQNDHQIRARATLIATNSPINDWIAIHTKQAPYRTYVIAGRVPSGSVVDALYWDTLDPYHYVRLQPVGDEHDWLIVGGEDHKTGKADDQPERIARLTEWARAHFPQMSDPEHAWSGQVMEPVDHLAYIGRNPGNENIFVVTGDSGEGLSNGVAGSLILRDLILGRENSWAGVYQPNRISIGAAGEYISENLTMPANLAEHLTGGELSSVDELKPGDGGLIRRGTTKLAAFRDDGGELHLRSATCTHAGCVVHWNGFERCWDCPCHGSHFSVDGEPLNAPAFKPLAGAQE
ncbi:glycine/D-amino acid oxidase-like deaminating enzyme/nitrite reductase/ring-hydroxylating ferredoxin subunit [Sinorhizobium fredii]|uniref:Putative rieske 2Fe-2S iron-sulfur protein YhfW n=1 Tax=Sinorhizobium fredii (strain USDA 257) TaxID=1185652 RepID=I3X1M7_SINF2|nr:FAD-dependent oxidoreductase [Sinorhizobium fredii]AFL49783.1 putative rieske 2Fe-2S iron-sulfur protein YhfW [Sinorhizobium fredii USDA 257]